MWPFFSSSYTSARINKVLVEIEMDQQPIPLQEQRSSLLINQNGEASSSAVQALHSIQESLADPYNDDSDEDDEAHRPHPQMSENSPTMTTKKELNIDLLQKLIDQPNLIQEIQMAKNSKLLAYISQDDVLDALVGYLVDSVPLFEKLYYEEQQGSENADNEELDAKGRDQASHVSIGDEEEEEDTGVVQVDDDEQSGNEHKSDDETDEEKEDDHESTVDPDDELPYGKETPEEKARRRATTAGEVLSVRDVAVIPQRLLLPVTDKVAIKTNEVSHFHLLNKLWNGMLKYDFKLENVVNLTLFVKIIENLINLNANEFMNFIRQNQQNHLLVDDILKHAAVPQFMDLMIKLISMDKIDNPIGLIDILHEQHLINKLLKLLDSDSIFLQNCVGDFLTSLISISANTPALFESETDNLANQMESPIIGPNNLTRSLVSEESINIIIAIIMKGGPCLPTCVSAVIEIIRKNNSDYDSVDLLDEDFTLSPPHDREPIFVGTMLKIFGEKLVDIFERYFGENFKVEKTPTTIGLMEPVGFERFKIVELIAELLHCSNMLLLNNVNAEHIMEKRNAYKNHKVDLMKDALDDNIIGDLSASNESVLVRHKSNDTYKSTDPFANATSGTNRGGDGKTSLIDLEKLTNDIKNFSVASEGSPSGSDEATKKPTSVSIGDFFKSQLLEADMLKIIFQMLHKFPWNNFLHNVIFDIAQQILNGRYSPINYNWKLVLNIFEHEGCYLTNYIVDCFELSEEKEEKDNLRLGYMGHLILISEEIVKFSLKVYTSIEDRAMLLENWEADEPTEQQYLSEMIAVNDQIHDIISEQKWLNYVDKELVTIRDMYNQVLGGVRAEDAEIYTNPDAIILGNGEEEFEDQEDKDEEEDNSSEDSDSDEELTGSVLSASSVSATEDTASNVDEHGELEEFGEELCPVQKHNGEGNTQMKDGKAKNT